MKIITQDEYNKITQTNDVLIAVNNLEVGQGLVVQMEEWTSKNTLASSITRKGKKFKTKLLPDRSGWAVLRIN